MLTVASDLSLIPTPADPASSAVAILRLSNAVEAEQRLKTMDTALASLRAATDRLLGYEFCHNQNVTYGHRVNDPSATLHAQGRMAG
jgi:hypothetical protein